MVDGVGKGDDLALTCFQRYFLLLTFHLDDTLLVTVALVLYGYFHLHPSLFGRHLRRGDEDAIFGNMQRGHGLEPHVAVDARTRVPAAVRLLRIVHLHNNLVEPFVLIKIRCHVNCERCIAIVMLTSLLSIDIDLCLLIDTLEVELDERMVNGQW